MSDVLRPGRADLFGPRSGLAQVGANSLSGGFALVASNLATQAIRFVAMLVVARLLTPGDFGIFAVVMGFVGIAGLLWELGLGTATVQRHSLAAEQVSAMFWVNVGSAALVTLTGLTGAAPLGAAYGDPRVETMCRLVAFAPLASALGMQHLALLQRALRFRTTAAIGLAATVVGTALTVVLALHGSGFIALVLGVLASQVTTTGLAWVACPWRPGTPRLDPETRKMLAFGGKLVGFGLLGAVASSLHNILLGLVSGADDAGIYYRAYSLQQLVQGLLLGVTGTVATAALSHLQDRPEEFRDYYLRCARLVCSLAAPAAALGWLFSGELLRVLYGPQWNASAPLFGILSLGILCYALSYSTGWIYVALGHAGRMMRWGLLGWSLVIAGTLIGLPQGLRGLAVAQTATLFVVFVPCMTLAFRTTLITWRGLGESAWRPVVAAAAGTALVVALGAALPTTPWLRLASGGSIFAFAYLFLLAEPLGQRDELLLFARALLGRKAASR